MKLKLKFNYVAVKPEELTKSKGGIFIPEKSKMALRRCIGEVVAVGPGNMSATGDHIIPMTTTVGERVLYVHDAMVSELETDDGQVILLMPESKLITELEKVEDAEEKA